ncbi:MAG: winged helix-turn-helix transcriptional regulator [Acidobacteriota bacterium]|nr:winged helix-turn-helix transcriptional regulator [Acidobacteriota bacterium]
MTAVRETPAAATWTFLTNHSHVLLCIADDPEARMRDLAERVGITERAVQRIIDDLAEAGYLAVEREGRRNRYRVHEQHRLRHPVEAHCEVAGLIGLVLGKARNRARK